MGTFSDVTRQSPERLDEPDLTEARRLVVKIGSSLLVDDQTGHIHQVWLDALADDVVTLRTRGVDVIIVSSGSIAVGRRHLGLTGTALKLEEKQAAAATGQIRLAHAYQQALARHSATAAQVLVTPDDTEMRRRHLNARATINTLLRLGAVPVINENDTVATSEIRYGDNDRLAARVAQMISADTLVLLSDIDGLYTADPRLDPEARFIPVVSTLTPDIEAMAGDPPPGYSSGGMKTKLAAARIATAAGCRMVITKGKCLNPLQGLDRPTGEGGAPRTWFLANAEPRAARKQWIAAHLTAKGRVVIDDGAVGALHRGKSLLPAGVVAVTGTFDRGDLIEIIDRRGRVIGRGLSAYAAADTGRIAGHRSHEIESLLGFAGREELIHRDDLALD